MSTDDGGKGADGNGTDRGAGKPAEPDSPPGIPLVKERELVAWREGTRTRVAELAALNTWIFQQASTVDAATFTELHSAINRHLNAALDATEGKRLWWKVRREGARLERALSNLDAAEAYLIRIAPASFVLGQLPSVLNQVQRHLGKDDPRRRQIEAIAKVVGVNETDKPPQVVQPGSSDLRLDLIAQERGAIVAALRGASSAALREQTRLQSFRNVIVVTTFAMTIVAIALAVIGWSNPTAIPLCFAPEENDLTKIVCPTQESDPFSREDGTSSATGGPTETTTPGAQPDETETEDTTTEGTSTATTAPSTTPPSTTPPSTTPTGTAVDATESNGTRDIDEVLSETVGPGNIALVEFIGITAAALAAANAIRRVRGSSEPYSVPIALALLKLPTGAVTAFLGLLLMRGGFVPGLSALDTSAQILAWAIIFGYAQQLFTRLVDEKAHSVLNAVRGGTE